MAEVAIVPFSSETLSARQRAWRYWYADGLPVVVVGFCLLAVALPFLLMRVKSLGPNSKAIVVFVAFVLYAVLLKGQVQLVGWFKTKFTYPRTGYVLEPPVRELEEEDLRIVVSDGSDEKRLERNRVQHENKKRAIFVIAALLVCAALAAWQVSDRWSALVGGILMGSVLWIGMRKEIRFPWPAMIVFPLVGIYLTIYPQPSTTVFDQIVYLWFASGVLFILLGLAMLIRYLVAHPQASAGRP